MECLIDEQFISSLAQDLAPGYLKFINKLNFRDCKKEITVLTSKNCDLRSVPKETLLSCLLLTFHRVTSLALQSNATLAHEAKTLKEQNTNLIREVCTANKKAMRYLDDLRSAESNLCSNQEELLKLRSERLVSNTSQSLSQASPLDEHLFPLSQKDTDNQGKKNVLTCHPLETPFSQALSFLPSSAVNSATPCNISEHGKGGSNLDSGFSDQYSSCTFRDFPDDSESSEHSGSNSPVWSLHHKNRNNNALFPHQGHRHLSASSPSQDIKASLLPHSPPQHKAESERIHRDPYDTGSHSTGPFSAHQADRLPGSASCSHKAKERPESEVISSRSNSPAAHSREGRSCSKLFHRHNTKTYDSSATLPIQQESDEHLSALASQQERRRQAQREAQAHTTNSSVSPSPHRQTSKTSDCLRYEELDLIAKDIEAFDPDNQDQNIDDYLREVEHNLSDLPRATQREKIRLIWKTSSRSVRTFIESQPSSIRNDYVQLCTTLAEEYSAFADETSATIAAIQVKHNRSEHPREFYRRLRRAFFHGKNGPGLEEDPAFKSLFLHNLHPCVRTQVALMARQDNPSMREIHKMTQMVWETVVRPGKERVENKMAPLKPTGSGNLATKTVSPYNLEYHPLHRNTTKGGGSGPLKENSDKRSVRYQRREHRPRNTERRPDQRVLVPTRPICDSVVDLPKMLTDYSSSDDDRDVSERISDSEGGYSGIYISEPRIKKHFEPKRYRGRFSCS